VKKGTFPKKVWFGNTDTMVVTKRCKALERWLNAISQCSGVSLQPAFLSFFESAQFDFSSSSSDDDDERTTPMSTKDSAFNRSGNALDLVEAFKQYRPSMTAPRKGTPAKVLFDFEARDANEMTVKAGSHFKILEVNGEWTYGANEGVLGYVPTSYVEKI